ncbi:MAG: flippase-like domain-containing protein [Deltaproteobacteria bacterium]|nr:flippase-like domain-containing protein [Deltaproteobacteria bacterium]
MIKPATRRALLIRGTIGTVVTCLFFAVLWRYIDLQRISELYASANWSLIGLAFLIFFALYISRSRRFAAVAPQTSGGTMLAITCVHNFLLRLVPMRMGDLSFAFLVRRAGTSGLAEGILSLVLIRLLDGLIVIVIFSVTLALNHAVYRADPLPSQIGACVVFVLGVLAIIFFKRLTHLGLRILQGTLSLLGVKRSNRLRSAVDKLGEAIAAFDKLRAPVLVVLCTTTVIQWILTFALAYVLLRAFHVEVTVAQAILGTTASIVSGFLPIGGIGSFGALEAGWTLGFTLVGLSPTVAVATAFGYSLSTLAFAAILGVVGWLALSSIERRRLATKGPQPSPEDPDRG